MPPQPAFYAEEGGVPVFTPTYEEFRDFATFVQAIEAFGNTAGLVKVIPPQEWHELNPTSVDRVQKLQIRNAISQSFSCGGYPAGIQQVMNIETKKQYSGILFHSVQEWYELSQTEAHRAPTMTMDGKMNLPLIKRRKYMHPAPGAKENQSNSNLHSSIAGKKKRSKKTLPEFMKTPTYFTPEYLSQLERFYWRNVSFESPLYGADMAGSVFGTNPNNKWNVARLESLLNKYPFPVPGVNLPYLYFGMYKATFAWHVEDMDLCSINYIHFGAPKQWYVVAPEHRLKFERFATGVFHEDYKVCKEFLRHKTCIISPSLLQQLSIPVHKVVQRAGEYMLTFPGAYHLGYNCGFNCAESVNFAFDSWIKIGKKSKACLCIGDTVRLDIPTLLDPSSCLTEAMKREYIASDQRSRRGLSKPDAAPLPTLPDPKVFCLI